MKLLLSAAALILMAPQQQKNANPDLKYDESAGISLSKPPKNDEWDFKEKENGAVWKECRFQVAHKVDELHIEIVQTPPSTQGAYDTKKQCENDFNVLKDSQGITEPKRIAMNNAKLPGNGAGGAAASYLEMSFKKADKLVEYRQ